MVAVVSCMLFPPPPLVSPLGFVAPPPLVRPLLPVPDPPFKILQKRGSSPLRPSPTAGAPRFRTPHLVICADYALPLRTLFFLDRSPKAIYPRGRAYGFLASLSFYA